VHHYNAFSPYTELMFCCLVLILQSACQDFEFEPPKFDFNSVFPTLHQLLPKLAFAGHYSLCPIHEFAHKDFIQSSLSVHFNFQET